jgi:excisionase family DNA binding protein
MARMVYDTERVGLPRFLRLRAGRSEEERAMAQHEPANQVISDYPTREPAPPESYLIDARETSALIRLSTPKIYQLASQGKLPVVRGFGRSLRINRLALLALIDSNTLRPDGGDE